MAKLAKELSALEISRLKEPKHHAVGGVPGLYLYINSNGARSWVLRTVVANVRRHMGLGSYPAVTLAMAREKARQAKEEIVAGVDPILKRNQLLSALKAQQVTQKTFEEAACAYIDAHGDAWKNPKHRAQWRSTLETYAHPVIGTLLVGDITHTHILSVLEPIWKTKNETAARLRGRIESVLDWATVRGLRSGDNPARWKGHLDTLLPSPGKVKKVTHHAAVGLDAMPGFMAKLRLQAGVSAKALEFAILCASRSGEVRGVTWNEVDLEKAIWTVPAERMKAKKEHRVPLSPDALTLLKEQIRQDGCPLIFPGSKGQPLSDMSLLAVMRRMKVDAVPHGFRSTFRDWVGEKTHYPSDVAETALAHALESKVEAAYRRGDALEKRREMMRDWAAFCRG